MCSVFLQREDWAKQIPWRGGPSSVMATNEGGQLEVGGGSPTVFPGGTCPIVGEASVARGVDGAVQEKTRSKSSNCPESDNEPPLRQRIPRKRARSTSVDSETDDEDEFASTLYVRLYEAAKYQESLEDTTDWSRGREGLICL